MVSLFRYPKRKLKKLLKDGEYDEAVRFGKSIEAEYSDDPDFMFIMGSVYFIVEDAKKAIPLFEKALALKNDDVETLMIKTNAHLFLQQKNEAIECCKKIIQIEPDNYEAHGLLEKLEHI